MPTKDTKKWYGSRTVWAGIVMFLAIILEYFGYNINAALQVEIINDVIMKIVEAGAAIAAIWYRIKASKSIK